MLVWQAPYPVALPLPVKYILNKNRLGCAVPARNQEAQPIPAIAWTMGLVGRPFELLVKFPWSSMINLEHLAFL